MGGGERTNFIIKVKHKDAAFEDHLAQYNVWKYYDDEFVKFDKMKAYFASMSQADKGKPWWDSKLGGTTAVMVNIARSRNVEATALALSHEASIEHAKRAQLFESRLNSGLRAA